ncbi:hypothetical protein ABTZ57_27720 [Streptomyces sp. NPDC094048]
MIVRLALAMLIGIGIVARCRCGPAVATHQRIKDTVVEVTVAA